MKSIFLQVADSTNQGINNISIVSEKPIWFWVAIVEFLIILFIIFLKNKNGKMENGKFDEINSYKNKEVDTQNVVDSIFKSKNLFKELSKKYHPDKFFNTDKHEIAQEIFQQITDNKNNYTKLKELETEALKKLK